MPVNRPKESKEAITIFYDGACPSCVRDRRFYERVAGLGGKQEGKNQQEQLHWFDITDQDDKLKQLGIDPQLALLELHIQTPQGRILSELDAYIFLLQRIFWLRPVAFILSLPIIRPTLAYLYHKSVLRRLKKSRRLPANKDKKH